MNPSRWRLDGKVALVSGASQGIGYACARELAALGADVLLVARDETASSTRASELAEEFGEREFFTFAADVAEAEQRLEVFDWIADLEVELSLLVNNAGGNVTKPTLDYTADEVRELIDTNVLSAFEMSRLAHPYLAEHGNAAIVNVASVSGLIHVRSGSPYGMTKAAHRAADAQPRLRMGRRRHPRQRGRAVVHPHAAHGGLAGRSRLSRRSAAAHADGAHRRAGGSGERRSRSCACRRRATSPANASRSTAGSCTTDSECACGLGRSHCRMFSA